MLVPKNVLLLGRILFLLDPQNPQFSNELRYIKPPFFQHQTLAQTCFLGPQYPKFSNELRYIKPPFSQHQTLALTCFLVLKRVEVPRNCMYPHLFLNPHHFRTICFQANFRQLSKYIEKCKTSPQRTVAMINAMGASTPFVIESFEKVLSERRWICLRGGGVII